MLVDVGLVALGGALLYLGAEWLVRGASRLALSLGVPSLLIGLTVVSYGTSAPEMIVSVVASLEGRGPIALGNAVGSNIANLGLILGVTALIAPPKTDGSLLRRELVVLLAASLAVPLLLIDGQLDRYEGALLVLGSIVFTYATIRWCRRRGEVPPGLADAIPEPAQRSDNKLVMVLLIGLGLALLVAGGRLLVLGAVELASDLGMSERVVGLTIVAIGTSMPELAASLVAALRGESDLAVGNVIGSNIFNTLLVLGSASLARDLDVRLGQIWFDFTTMGVLTLLAVWMLRRPRRVSRFEGAFLTALYAVFLGTLVATGG